MTKRNGMGWDELDIWEKTTRNVRADTRPKKHYNTGWILDDNGSVLHQFLCGGTPWTISISGNNHIEDPE